MSSSPKTNYEEEETAYLAAFNLLSYHGIAMAVKAAVELDIFNILARAGPEVQLTAQEIANHIPNCDPTKAVYSLDRVLRFLASHEIICCSTTYQADDVERRYSNAPIYRHLITNPDGASLVPGFLFIGHEDSQASWQRIKEAVLEGTIPFIKDNGMEYYQYMAKNLEWGELFNKYMENWTKLVMEKIIEVYRGFEEISELVDVGGGIGGMLKKIISKYNHIKGINFDLPHVISSSPSIPGVKHVAGDMFVSIPRGEAIFLKKILHNWGDEDCVRILKNCYNALPDLGKVIIVEQILPDIPNRMHATQHVHYMDVSMMLIFSEGKERSEKEFKGLASKAGFSQFKVVCHAMNYYVMEFMK